MINMVQLLGRVGRVETKPLNTGGKVTNISMVTSKKYYNKESEKVEKITWHNICLYGGLSDVAEKFVSIGDLVFILGELDKKNYTGADGIERTSCYIVGHKLNLMPKSVKDYKSDSFEAPDEEVPF